MSRLQFWLGAAGAAIAITVLIALAFPYGALGLQGEADRHRALLLSVWTVGVLAICFGATGLLAVHSPIGFRDVAEAGSVDSAIRTHRQQRAQRGESPFYNFAGWTVTTGGMLILAYFVLLLALSPTTSA